MKIDDLIKKRLEELEQKAEAISANKVFAFEGEDGVRYFKVNAPDSRAWATSVMNLLQRVFGEDSPHYKNFSQHYQHFHGYEENFENCRAIFRAAKEDYEGGYLFNTRGLIQAEVFSDFLEQATELLQAGHKDPACVVAGVALETTLKELCAIILLIIN